MTLLLLESFDDAFHDDNDRFAIPISAVNTASGLHDRGANLGDRNNVGGDFAPTTTDDTLFWGFAWRADYNNALAVRYCFRWSTDVASDRQRLSFDTTSNEVVLRYGNAAETRTVVPEMGDEAWHYIEMKILYSTTVGTFDLWIDGVSKISETGKNTGSISSLMFLGGSTSPWDHYVDDVYVCDSLGTEWNANVGPLRVDALLPNGNGNSSVLLGSDGNSVDNYLQVDGQTLDEAAYNGSATQGDKDLYAMPALGATADTIHGVFITASVQKDDAGAKYGRIVTRSNVTDYVGTSEVLAQSWALQTDVRTLDPDTAAAWTQTNVEAAEFGWEVRDS